MHRHDGGQIRVWLMFLTSRAGLPPRNGRRRKERESKVTAKPSDEEFDISVFMAYGVKAGLRGGHSIPQERKGRPFTFERGRDRGGISSFVVAINYSPLPT